jgi:tRNA 2-thiouridine synthesizing protein A
VSPVEPIIVEARGHRCPVPALRLRQALAAAPAGAMVRLLTDDPLARIDVPHMLGQAGQELVEIEVQGTLLMITARAQRPG